MSSEKATGLVLRTTDWSETSRIATLWTREFGKVRVLAKGGRRLKSAFENALDLLTVCGMVFLRKSAGSLDLLTEARVERRFPRLRTDLTALYAAYYVAELLDGMTEDYDPHPALFDEAVAVLDWLGSAARDGAAAGPRLMRFEVALLHELGYSPALDACSACGGAPDRKRPSFSSEAGGLLCPACQTKRRDRRPLSSGAVEMLQALRPAVGADPEAWRRPWTNEARREVRQTLGHYFTWLLGRRPRLLPYLGS
jgi:DNA repair protein RecO (recombination protein O)